MIDLIAGMIIGFMGAISLGAWVLNKHYMPSVVTAAMIIGYATVMVMV